MRPLPEDSGSLSDVASHHTICAPTPPLEYEITMARRIYMLTVPSPPSSISGLSHAEVLARQASEGFNELPRPDQRTTLRIILEVLREPCSRCCSAAV